MPYSRRILLGFSRFVLHLTIVMTIFSAVFASLVGSPNTIKEILSKSGVYDQVLDTALSKAEGKESGSSLGENEQIKQIVGDVLTPQKLQNIVEEVTDGTYRWLEGETAKPDFVVDLSDAKVAIANAVADRAIERLKSLPVCRSVPKTLDPFETKCRPPRINYTTERKRLIKELLANENFLPNPIITADTLPKDEEGRTFTERFSELPRAFKIIKLMPWVFMLLVTLSAASVVFAAETKRLGISKVGNSIFWDGAFIFGVTVVFGKLLPGAIASVQTKVISGGSSPVLNNIFKTSIDKIVGYTLIYSAIAVGIGGTIWAVEKFTQPKPQVKTKSKK